MAGVMGLEPTASAVTGRRCNQLNYTPAGVKVTKESILVFQIKTKVNKRVGY